MAEFSVSLCNAPKFRYFGRPGLLFRAPQLGSYTGTELQLGIPEFSEPGPGPDTRRLDGGLEPGGELTVIRREVPVGAGCNCDSGQSKWGLEWAVAIILLAGWRRRITASISVND